MNKMVGNERQYVFEVIERGFDGFFNKKLEREFAKKFGVKYAIGVNSGTSALHTALAAVGVKPGDEVITPAFTFSAPAFAVLQQGATPIFADINENSWNVTEKTIEPLVTKKTAAIIVVHLYGLPAYMPTIIELAAKYGIRVIEDCAECFLGNIDGKPVGTFGDVAIFSFERSKHMTSGHGGMIITNDEFTARKARKFSVLGYSTVDALSTGYSTSKEVVQHPSFARHYQMGYNYKLPELCAAVALAQLEQLDEKVDKRCRIGKIFDEIVGDFPILTDRQTDMLISHTYWTYAFALKKSSYWEPFRRRFLDLGGHQFYAGWRVVYKEPFFNQEDKGYFAEELQPRLVCLKTNFDSLSEAQREAGILCDTLNYLYSL